MKAVSKLRLVLGLAAVAVTFAVVPQVAQAAVAIEGCLVAKKNTLCAGGGGGDEGLQWTDHRSAAYTSAEGYFQYHGIGPWTIQYASGTINCPAATTCQRFFPEVLVPIDSQLLLSQTKNGTVFAGALQSAGGGD
jgi:hypothetical protein